MDRRRAPVRGLAGLLAAILAPAFPLAAQQPAVAFVDVTVVPMDRERVLEHQTVVVRDGRITAMGDAEATPVPAGATRVAGAGRWLLPGLAEMHGHIPGGSGAFTEDVLFLYVAGGATTVRGMQGNPAQLELRRRVEAGELIGPRLVLGSPQLAGGLDPDAARTRVRAHAEAGFDLLKIQEGLSVAAYEAIVAEARAQGLNWGGHVPDAVGLERALAAGQITVDHLDNYYEAAAGDHARIPELAARTRAAGVAVVPTMALWEIILGAHPAAAMLDRPELRYMPRATVAQWTRNVDRRASGADTAEVRSIVAFRNAMLKGLSDAGAEILMGTDAPQLFSVPGFSLRRELAAMAAAGMTPYEILRTGTVNVARHLGLEAEAGTVAVGKRADLLLLEADPLRDIAAVERLAGVMVAGRWLDRAALDARLEEIAARGGVPDAPLTWGAVHAGAPEKEPQ
ncbi:MAG: amidohydrolase family protein [Gemmatimonadota bacterium]